MRKLFVRFILAAAVYFFIGGPLLSWLIAKEPLELNLSPVRLVASVICGIVVVYLSWKKR